MWTAIISASAALLGVLIGQFWQGQRDAKRWLRERERDAELWTREDRHRFTNAKREHYTDFLTLSDWWRTNIDNMAAQLAEFGDDEVHGRDYLRWAQEHEFGDIFDVQQSAFRASMSVRLICPPNVAAVVLDLIGRIHTAQEYVLSGLIEQGYDLAVSATPTWNKVFELMAADLNQSPSRSSGGA